MNREQRRKAQKQGQTIKPPTVHHITNAQLQAIKKDIEAAYANKLDEFRNQFAMLIIDTVLSASVVSLADKFNFDQEQLQRFINHMEDQLECVTKGVVTLEEIQSLFDEFGVSIHAGGQANET